MSEVIYQYIRGRGGRPKGCLAAVQGDDGQVQVGWSLCRKGDTFTKSEARRIAEGRARKGTWKGVKATRAQAWRQYRSRYPFNPERISKYVYDSGFEEQWADGLVDPVPYPQTVERVAPAFEERAARYFEGQDARNRAALAQLVMLTKAATTWSGLPSDYVEEDGGCD